MQIEQNVPTTLIKRLQKKFYFFSTKLLSFLVRGVIKKTIETGIKSVKLSIIDSNCLQKINNKQRMKNYFKKYKLLLT